MFPQDQSSRKFFCFVCGANYDVYNDMAAHIKESHEQGREYLICPLKHCGCPVRDLRAHFKAKHKFNPLPKNMQLRATVMYDLRLPGKKKKLPTFKEGYFESKKNSGKMHYRSSFEYETYVLLENISQVERYKVEPFHIEYYYKGKRRRYYPDLQVFYSGGIVEIWEIKPENQLLNEQNLAKFNSAKMFCSLRGWVFRTISEDDIANLRKNLL